VLDLCASPGGKTVALAAAAGVEGRVVACDVRPKRIALLRETLARCAVTHARVVHVDAEAPLPFRAAFDRVLVDAPCSGLGTVRRDPDIRWHRRPEDLPRLAAAQQDLLARAAAVVRPGGRLLYSTCSSEPEENAEVVRAFLGTHPGFRTVPLQSLPLPSAVRALADEDGWLRTSPPRDRLEAFFAALLERAIP
jgi:16S rRNA (cytosine967-C5)-methyltransferase